MQNIIKTVQAVAITGLLAFAGSATGAFAAGPASPRVAVPDRPGPGSGVNGCYSVIEKLYGPYSMTFCLGNRGNYRVTGGGLNCDGRPQLQRRRPQADHPAAAHVLRPRQGLDRRFHQLRQQRIDRRHRAVRGRARPAWPPGHSLLGHHQLHLYAGGRQLSAAPDPRPPDELTT